ncbi:maternal effect protein oskar isoform X2 [Ceratitis capitata]|nr:maternal effect protein oskar isoform X2 [Ceratitis capitata]
MTIMSEAFLELRNEYPDLDVVIRSILMARSQEGATISDIKDDYRKNTGNVFPIFQSITEFLLSIPLVTAFCNEDGKLIFNVRPTDRTKHIFDMVQQQKPQQYQPQQHQPQQQQHQTHKQQDVQYNRQRGVEPRLNNISKGTTGYDQSWYHNNKQNDYQSNLKFIDKNNIDNNKEQLPININVVQANPNIDKSKIQPISGNKIFGNYVAEANNSNYYQDNCNHLFNRLYNQSKAVAQNFGNNIIGSSQSNLNNGVSKYQPNQAKSIIYPTQTRSNQQQNYCNTNKLEKQFPTFNHPILKSSGPNTNRASSPSCTRSSRDNNSIYTSDSDYEAHLLDFPLLGDDFFLFLARMELRCKFKKYGKVLQSGLCVSGQTICAAIRRVHQLDDQHRSIIVNIGSVDIMKGRSLVQIEHDFRELINVIFKKGFTPILTTLAPLANYAHDKQVKTKLERFNHFIKNEGKFLVVMDIWACLVNEKGQILFDCFQNEPRMVSGTSEPYVFWNKIGRQRVLQLIESQLEY